MSNNFPRNQSVPGLIEAHAARHPDAVAVVFGARRLTYRELNARSNRLARHLVKLGVGPEVPVGLCVERSAEMVVALLAILKAGGAYVPLDPSYPPDRLAFTVADSGVRVLLVGRSVEDRVPAADGVRVSLEEEPGPFSAEDETNLASSPGPGQLMYVIYTSGSTGRPKGVAVEHGSVVNLVQTSAVDFGFSPADVWTVVHSFGFDFSVWEIWGCLCNGGRLVVVPLDVIQSPVAFYDVLRRERVTVLNQIPSGLRNFLMTVSPDCDLKISDLRLIVCGGEALPRELARDLLRWGIPLWNFYGPTEATVWATNFHVETADFAGAYVPIGTPMANMQAYILDGAGNPVRPGETGELYLGGAGIARGYWRRPDLTAERFIPDRFSGMPGARLYRTGDLAKRQSQGPIEFVGRSDTQVKVRGYRIELAEIESALARDPSVKEAVVLARQDEPGDPRLVAYVVPAPGRTIARWELRERLRNELPDYMVPSTFVRLESFPLNANGKLDRSALPPPGKARLDQFGSYEAPGDIVEIRLARLWSKVLRVDPIGLDDDFFDLGGHSLIAVRLFSLIEKNFGLRLPLAAIFQAPTLRRFASLVRAEGTSPSWSFLVAIQAKGSRPPLYCVHALGGNVLSYERLSRYLGNDQPLYGLQAQGLDGKRSPHETVEEMATHYIGAIRQLQERGPYFLAGWSFGGTVAYEMACQLQDAGEQVALLALIDTENAKATAPSAPSQDGDDAAFVSRRVRFQLAAMKDLSPAKRAGHLFEKAGVAARWLGRTVKTQYEERRVPKPIRIINAANYAALREFVPRRYDGNVVLFRAGDPPSRDRFLGWGNVPCAGLEVIPIPGDHLTVLKEPHVRTFARRLEAALSTVAQLDSLAEQNTTS